MPGSPAPPTRPLPRAAALLTVAMIAHPLLGTPADVGNLDRFVAAYADVRDYAGVVLIQEGDEILFHRAYGEAHVGLGVANQLDSRFGIASLTKGFTAEAVSRLAERGALSLGDTLDRFVPSFPSGDRITLGHLLEHRSGVDSRDSDSLGVEPATLDDAVAELARLPLLFEPGTDESYSNGGYILLAKVIEVASGSSWDAFVHDEILAPLGLTATGAMQSDRPIPQLSQGYDPAAAAPPLGLPRPFDYGHKTGAGHLYSSTPDLARWGRFVASERRQAGTAGATPPGWWLDERDGVEILSQSGRLAGYAADLLVLPHRDLVLVSLANVRTGAARRVANALESWAFGEPIAVPDLQPYRPLTFDEWAGALGAYRHSEELGVELTATEGGLTARLQMGGGSHELPVTPRGDGELADRLFYTSYRLEAGPDGGVEALVFVDDSGNETRLERLAD